MLYSKYFLVRLVWLFKIYLNIFGSYLSGSLERIQLMEGSWRGQYGIWQYFGCTRLDYTVILAQFSGNFEVHKTRLLESNLSNIGENFWYLAFTLLSLSSHFIYYSLQRSRNNKFTIKSTDFEENVQRFLQKFGSSVGLSFK